MKPVTVSDRLHDFTRFLRGHGYDVGIDELNDSMLALASMDEPNRKQSEYYLRSILCRNAERWQQFHTLFDRYWYAVEEDDLPTEETQWQAPALKQQQQAVSGIAGTSTDHFKAMEESNMGVGAGKQNTIGKADFRFLKDARAMREAERLSEQLAQQLKRRIKRKKKIVARGRAINIRHTLRASLGTGGIPLYPRYSLQVKQPPKLLVLHDVSHSMTWNNPLLFRFVRGLVNVFNDTEAFVFHTRLHHVTELFREPSLDKMRKQLEAKNNLWLGGTCIADSLASFNKEFAGYMLSPQTRVMLISDGFDTNEPARLVAELNKIKRRANRILWLNPMQARDGYDENNVTAATIRPHVDCIAPAHSLDSLRAILHAMR